MIGSTETVNTFVFDRSPCTIMIAYEDWSSNTSDSGFEIKDLDMSPNSASNSGTVTSAK